MLGVLSTLVRWKVIAALVQIAAYAGLVTHVAVCARWEWWGFLVVGALILPLGALHGWFQWLHALVTLAVP